MREKPGANIEPPVQIAPGCGRKRGSAEVPQSTLYVAGCAKLDGLGNASHERQFKLMGYRRSGVTVCVTVSSSFMRIQTDKNGLAAALKRCKLLILGSFPLVHGTHNAGVEGSSPSLFRYPTAHRRRTLGSFQRKVAHDSRDLLDEIQGQG
jgi:hypothetical protein